MKSLQFAFEAGDVIALIQAMDFARHLDLAIPEWVSEPLLDTFLGVLERRPGKEGRGNSAFGALRKSLIRTVRASAYHYVRAWQRDPHRYHDLPIHTFENWNADPKLWQPKPQAELAARHAGDALHGTAYMANASTVRRAAHSFPPPVRWGRAEAEAKLGLRDNPKAVFGPKATYLAPHIEALLAMRKPKPKK